MPTATLRFTLPEDEPEFRYALAGRDALIALEQIDTFCRNRLKHCDPPPEAVEILEAIRGIVPYELLETLQ